MLLPQSAAVYYAAVAPPHTTTTRRPGHRLLMAVPAALSLTLGLLCCYQLLAHSPSATLHVASRTPAHPQLFGKSHTHIGPGYLPPTHEPRGAHGPERRRDDRGALSIGDWARIRARAAYTDEALLNGVAERTGPRLPHITAPAAFQSDPSAPEHFSGPTDGLGAARGPQLLRSSAALTAGLIGTLCSIAWLAVRRRGRGRTAISMLTSTATRSAEAAEAAAPGTARQLRSGFPLEPVVVRSDLSYEEKMESIASYFSIRPFAVGGRLLSISSVAAQVAEEPSFTQYPSSCEKSGDRRRLANGAQPVAAGGPLLPPFTPLPPLPRK